MRGSNRKFAAAIFVCVGLVCALLVQHKTQSPEQGAPTVPHPQLVLTSSKPSLEPRLLTYEGVQYSLPLGNGSRPSMYHFVINFDKGYLAKTPHILHWHQDGLYLLGNGYGKVSSGDHVEVTSNNRLFVNGQERSPVVAV